MNIAYIIPWQSLWNANYDRNDYLGLSYFFSGSSFTKITNNYFTHFNYTYFISQKLVDLFEYITKLIKFV